MAQGDLTIFESFAEELGQELHHFDNDLTAIRLGIVDDTITPTAADRLNGTTPRWSDYSANQVSAAGNYVTGGVTLTSVTWTPEVDGVATLNAANYTINQDGGGFTDARWAILYNDNADNDNAIAFIDLGGTVSEQDGDITFAWDASGILTVTVT